MEDSATALWLVIATGAAAGLLTSILGHALLRLPLVRVKVRHNLRIAWDEDDSDFSARVESYVSVTNLRERPVTIDNVWILRCTDPSAAGTIEDEALGGRSAVTDPARRSSLAVTTAPCPAPVPASSPTPNLRPV